MQRRQGQETLSFFLLLFYIVFSTPSILFYLQNNRSDISRVRDIVLPSFFLFVFIGLELGNLFGEKERTNLTVSRTVFYLRVLLIGGAYFLGTFYFDSESMLGISPLTMLATMLTTALPFCSYSVFSRKISLSVLAFCLLFPTIPMMIRASELTDQLPFDSNQIGVTSYRTISILFFYFLAWLLDEEARKREKIHDLLTDLRKSEKTLREYANQIAQTVALEERTRIARDIHDSLGHALTAIKIQLAKAEAYFERDPGESQHAIKAAKETTDDAMEDVQTSLDRLNGEIADISLVHLLPRLIKLLEDVGIRVDSSITGSEEGYNYSVMMGLYRLCQEGVTNILKHSRAQNVTISVEFGDRYATVELADDGSGFVPDASERAKQSGGYGLIGMRRRLELVRGYLAINSAPGEGTKIIAVAPKDPVSLI